MRQIAKGKTEGPYKWRNGLVLYKNRVVVPQEPTIRNKLLKKFHNSKSAGHSGVLRTYKRLAQQFYWPKMFKSVHTFVSECAICQKTKTQALTPAGLLQPLPIPC